MPDALSTTLAALADPTRRAIIEQLARGEATVTELATPHPISLPAISRHVRVLVEAGLVVQTRDAQRRPCRLAPSRLHELQTWLQTHRAFFEDRFDRLGAQLSPPTPDPQEPQ